MDSAVPELVRHGLIWNGVAVLERGGASALKTCQTKPSGLQQRATHTFDLDADAALRLTLLAGASDTIHALPQALTNRKNCAGVDARIVVLKGRAK